MTATTSRTPIETAQIVARNAVPEVREALALMRIPAEVDTGEVIDGYGTVSVAMRSGDAYEFARWARTHATEDEHALHKQAR
ncbi:hypothetical protein HRW16_30305 [Streptomyces lunaelactis]|uniref:hypothetical protein n=1 Tax=Streptomyces lunaelactis TaxID=1535768 RepID=UPI0015845BB0|nr:hypothetical protein [Streptomyces lunaelactis]NUK38362.1 hypothetical protein [Streptomyces lunaelactis]NUK45409.1 hypothetical protein [Streptomyces lunaelactis]NUK61467.1 hypothetical protein [Streptomyces lunaelactis]NUK96046.1 hypothetical protein [Streptomyces lunaelactis]NUL33901.1 hypothetical protein [Streptomyces lunaelactis]